ncbi:contractile injection system protein, VgrG/Pvc8 family [Paenibacillus sp. 8b26]|uniref:contractile injection system protein, VgrG/Pvc8 family n=1 Tax=Paenibacillus sp. 8b26 TaxID=3424133 RepID=UPI003D66000B
MSLLTAGIGYESLRFYGPFQPHHIEQLQITRTINDHAYLHISGLLSEKQGAACIGQDMEQEPIVIRQLDEQGQSLRRLFHGIVTRMSVHCVRGVYTFELEAASHSYQMDIKVKRRSYQDIHRTYDDLVTTMVRKYQYGDAIDTVSNYAKLETFVLQYDETDWAFLKRLASRFGSVLVPEVTAASPKVFFGMPEGKQHKVERDVFYRVRKTFHELDAEKPGEQRAGSYVTYMIESLQYYALGDLITLPIGQGKELVVTRAVTQLEDGLLRTRYDLQAEQNIRYARYENDQTTGISLTGTVLKVQQDFVQLQLEIDPKQDPAKVCWFPVATRYVAEEHSGWYDMPEIGEQVELYLPTHREQDAYVTDSLRQQRHANGQPNVKVWQHVQGSGVEMSEQELTLSTSDGFSITLNEDGGITVNSPGNVQIQGGHVKLDAGEELSLEAGTALYLKGGASSMVLDGETDIKAPMIDQEGTVKAPVFVADLPPVPEPPLMNIKAYEAAQSVAKDSSSSQASTPKAKVTTPAALQQANALMGTISKLLGSIPAVGNVANVMLNTVGGPAGKVAAIVLQATGAIPIRSKGTPTIGGSNKGNGVHPLKYLAGLALEGLISQYEHEQARQAYYSKWILGKVYTSARHLADSGGPLELVQNLLKESNAMVHAYQQVPKSVREKMFRDYEEKQRIQAEQTKKHDNSKLALWRERKTSEYTSYWNQTDYFTANWWQDEGKLKQAEQALRTEITMRRKLSLYDIKDPNKMAAIQRIVNTKRTHVWDEGTLNAIENGLVAMGVDSTNAIELDKEKMDALIARYNQGFIGQKSGDYMERTGLSDLVEDTTYGVVGARIGMGTAGRSPARTSQPPIVENPPVKPNPKGGPGVNRPIDEFNDSPIYNGANSSRPKETSKPTNPSKPPEGTGKDISHPVLDNARSGSGLKKQDGQHGFNDIIDNYTPYAKEFEFVSGDGVKRKLYQIKGGMKYYDYKDVYNKDLRINERITTVKDQNGIFEWIVDPTKGVTHRRFIPNGQITGLPNQRP